MFPQVLNPAPNTRLAHCPAATKAAEHYHYLRGKDVTIRKTVDPPIATFCIDQKFALLFSDKDFRPFVKHLGLQSALSRG